MLSPTPATDHEIRLHVMKFGLWSVTKIGFLIGVFFGLVTFAICSVAWTSFSNGGGLKALAVTISGDPTSTALSSFGSIASTGTVMSVAAVLAVMQVIGTTAFVVVIALFYNVTTRFTGGILGGFVSGRSRR